MSKKRDISDISGLDQTGSPDLIERIEKQKKYASNRHDTVIEAQNALNKRMGALTGKEKLKKDLVMTELARKRSEHILSNLNYFFGIIKNPNTDPELRENLVTIYNNKELDNSRATTAMDLAENTYLIKKERAEKDAEDAANYVDWSQYGGVSGKSRKRKSIRKKNKKTRRR